MLQERIAQLETQLQDMQLYIDNQDRQMHLVLEVLQLHFFSLMDHIQRIFINIPRRNTLVAKRTCAHHSTQRITITRSFERWYSLRDVIRINLLLVLPCC